MSSKLAPHQIIQDVYEPTSSSIKTTLQNLEIAVELSADDGDSVEARVPLFTGKSEPITPLIPSGTVVAMGDVRYFSDFLVVVNVTSEITAADLKIHVEVSPSDTDDVWYYNNQLIKDLAVPSTGVAADKTSTIGPWRRARAVVFYTSFTAGSFDLYANGR